MADYSKEDFNIKQLGSFYHNDKTVFKVFAPYDEILYLCINNHKYLMHHSGKCFQIALKGNLEKVGYHFMNADGICFKDPLAYCGDDKDSYVLDTDKFIHQKVLLNKMTDIIIYETSVRDFSCADSFKGKYRRKFLAFAENGLSNNNLEIGLDYLSDIGITHLQLMPVLDFDNDGSNYNWGYNPVNFNYVKKDYLFNEEDPYAYINELRQTINELHSHNIRVTLDVVYNHVYDRDNWDLSKILKQNALRHKKDGSFALGSMCGNEIKSEDPFIQEYLLEMTLRYVRLFDIDGIRIDQMGILDYDTVNLLNEEAKKIKEDFIVYGEGWDMGDVLDKKLRASITNADKLPQVAMFNDNFRDNVINYLSGNLSISADVKKALGANSILKCQQSINYVECHDDNTFFDRMMLYKSDDPLEINIRRCKLAMSLVILAKGIAFIHSGQEFLRSKNMLKNTYNCNEDVNLLDWNRRVLYSDVCDYLKQLIEIRKEYPVFINPNVDASFEDYYECIIYKISNLLIIINPCKYDHIYDDGNVYQVIFDMTGKTNYQNHILSIPAYSLIICKY